MCVCVYVCMFVCMYVCMYVWICIHIYIYPHVCLFVRISTYVHRHTYIYIYLYIYTHIHTHIHISIYIYILYNSVYIYIYYIGVKLFSAPPRPILPSQRHNRGFCYKDLLADRGFRWTDNGLNSSPLKMAWLDFSLLAWAAFAKKMFRYHWAALSTQVTNPDAQRSHWKAKAASSESGALRTSRPCRRRQWYTLHQKALSSAWLLNLPGCGCRQPWEFM